ncbi:MAG: hypothetical protein FWD47_07270 [Treponema sp.]|nr:hypothetical protein [Treponema sp.]
MEKKKLRRIMKKVIFWVVFCLFVMFTFNSQAAATEGSGIIFGFLLLLLLLLLIPIQIFIGKAIGKRVDPIAGLILGIIFIILIPFLIMGISIIIHSSKKNANLQDAKNLKTNKFIGKNYKDILQENN